MRNNHLAIYKEAQRIHNSLCQLRNQAPFDQPEQYIENEREDGEEKIDATYSDGKTNKTNTGNKIK